MTKQKRNKSFETFGRMAFEELTECLRENGVDVDADRLAEYAIKCGLMKQVKFDPAKHGEGFYDHDYEPGDLIYWWGE